jgi:hypothetical protein
MLEKRCLSLRWMQESIGVHDTSEVIAINDIGGDAVDVDQHRTGDMPGSRGQVSRE